MYSKGLPSEIVRDLSDNDIVGSYLDFVTKYVLWSDILDWERDIKDYGKKKEEVKRQRRLINESCGCESASTKGYVAYFVVREFPKILKGIAEKR